VLDTLRKPFFVAALLALLLAVLIELGSGPAFAAAAPADLPAPGFGIRYLALLDGLVLFTVCLFAAPMLLSARVVGRIQGVASAIVAVLMLIAAIILLVVAVQALLLMVALFMAVPFGTAIYAASFGSFPMDPAAAALGAIMLCKLLFCGLLIAAQQRFLENRGLVLHGLPPSFLVSISDAVGAIIVAILAVIWALAYLLGAIPAIVKALRVDRALG
jgi:hypothetical protein